MSDYYISETTLTLKDSPQHIDFHIQSGDYFSFLATMIGFLEETLAQIPDSDCAEHQHRIARELRNDLRYVQANYKIVPRPLEDIEMIRPKGNLIGRED